MCFHCCSDTPPAVRQPLRCAGTHPAHNSHLWHVIPWHWIRHGPMLQPDSDPIAIMLQFWPVWCVCLLRTLDINDSMAVLYFFRRN